MPSPDRNTAIGNQASSSTSVGRPGMMQRTPLSRDSTSAIRKRSSPQGSLITTFDAETQLPKGAQYTGYRTDFMELWLDPNNHAAAYLVFADHVERWPRANDTVACA